MSVLDILGWIGDSSYFVGTKTSEPGSRHLYKGLTQSFYSVCLTCDLPMATDNSTVCQYSDFYVSTAMKYYVQVSRLHINHVSR